MLFKRKSAKQHLFPAGISLRWWSWRPWLQASRLCWTSSTGFQSSPSTRSLSTNGRSEDLGPFSILWLLSQNLSQDLNGTNFLGLVFQDPVRWGLAFESLVGSLECRISESRTPRPWPKITKRQRQWHLTHPITKTMTKTMTNVWVQVTLTMAEIHMADHDGAEGLLFHPVKV